MVDSLLIEKAINNNILPVSELVEKAIWLVVFLPANFYFAG